MSTGASRPPRPSLLKSRSRLRLPARPGSPRGVTPKAEFSKALDPATVTVVDVHTDRARGCRRQYRCLRRRHADRDVDAIAAPLAGGYVHRATGRVRSVRATTSRWVPRTSGASRSPRRAVPLEVTSTSPAGRGFGGLHRQRRASPSSTDRSIRPRSTTSTFRLRTAAGSPIATTVSYDAAIAYRHNDTARRAGEVRRLHRRADHRCSRRGRSPASERLHVEFHHGGLPVHAVPDRAPAHE